MQDFFLTDFIQQNQPVQRDFILLNEFHLFCVLCHLKLLGAFDRVSGILLGTFTKMEEAGHLPDLLAMVNEYAGDLPVARTDLIGHGADARGIVIGEYRVFEA